MHDTWAMHENRSLMRRGLKRCSKCKAVKKLDDFHKANPKLYKSGRKSACKLCLGTRNPWPQKTSEERVKHLADNERLLQKGKKRCWQCKKAKPLKAYWRNPSTSDGYKSRCIPCDQERVRKWNKDWNWKNRRLAIEKYGGKCKCCGEARFEFLAIDHENGGGNRHRLSGQFKPGSGFIKWLKKNGWPKGYRVLCHNCNQAIGFYGYCPHQKNGKRSS